MSKDREFVAKVDAGGPFDGRNGRNGRNEKNDFHSSHSSHSSQLERVVPPRGDYRTLLSFQKAELVYDFTFRFAKKFLGRGDRTVDQMIQAARSGKKNLLEGSKAGTASKEMEIKLTTVARGSLEELLDDYLDFLRVRDLRLWAKDSKEALYMRRLGRKTPLVFEDLREIFETRPPETLANMAVCLIHQTNYLIDRQLETLDREFVVTGGLRERMTRVRLEYRARKRSDDGSG